MDQANRTALHTYDPFGAPLDTQPADQTVHRYTGAWAKQYDTASNLILMGARPYDPSIGRFLAVDPIDGGSLNNYDYAGQDPITKYDLDGTMLAISGSQERQMQEDRDALINDSTLLFGQFGPTIGDVAVTARADHLKSACKAMTDCELHPRTCLQDMSPVQSSAVQRDSHKYAGARNGNVARGVKDACGLAGHALLGLSAVTKLDPWVSVPCVAFDFAVAINDIF